ncbi:MAG: DUF3570 domain-containing protein [Ferruginibacter sp.]
MKKICLVVVGFYIGILAAFSQKKDSSVYKKRKLTMEEINIVSAYYSQDGNNSAVTGGIGTEELKDYSLNAELKLFKYDQTNRKKNWNINLGVDFYTSASTDNINPENVSSASSNDFRFYPSIEHIVEDEAKKKKLNYSLSFSIETDYLSFGIGTGITKSTKDNNQTFTAKAQCYIDQVKIILPYEMRTPETGGLYGYPNEHDYPWKARTTFGIFLSYSKVINKSLQLALVADPAYQHGFLGMPFHRVYFTDSSLATEHLPSSRFKIPLGIRANYFAGNRIILRSFYRFYHDGWGLNAHTADLEAVLKLNPFFSISSFYRFYTQQGIQYFAPYKTHLPGEQFYSSNYDLSAFDSHFFGAGIRFTPAVLKGITQAELRYGHYLRSNSLHSDVISLFLKIK